MLESKASLQEELKFKILLVGGGPANLACAIHLLDLIKEHNVEAKKIESGYKIIDIEDKLCVIEKGSYIGAHSISGAILDPGSLEELIPNYISTGFPYESEVKKSEYCFLTKKKAYIIPFANKYLRALKNKGKYLISLGKLTNWLGEEAEKRGAVILPGYSAEKMLYGNADKIMGIRASSVDLNGKTEYNLHAEVTVVGDGANGNLSQEVITKYGLSQEGMTYALSCKEIWEIPEGRIQKGSVINFTGYPLNLLYKPGGGFVYGLSQTKVSLGLFTHLTSKYPLLNTHKELSKLKSHPYIKWLLKGGQALSFGSKVITTGGYYSKPKATHNNVLIIGEAGGLLNSKELKGIHIAIKSGILAAKTLYECIKAGDYSKFKLNNYEELIKKSYIEKELYRSRNHLKHIHFPERILNMFKTKPNIRRGSDKGVLLNKLLYSKNKNKTLKPANEYKDVLLTDKKLLEEQKSSNASKKASVYLSNTRHNESERPSIYIKDKNLCKDICYPKYKAPCTHYCPSGVYELNEKKDLLVHFGNCIHCKAAELRCPYDNIVWNVPGGGDGPGYNEM